MQLIMAAHILSIQHSSYFFRLFSLDDKLPENTDLACLIVFYPQGPAEVFRQYLNE